MKHRTLNALAIIGISVASIVALVLNWPLFPSNQPAIPILGSVPPSAESFEPFQAVSRPPLVTGFDVLSVDQAKGKLNDDELVLAVEIDGEARAWPLNVMTGPDREVFNDTLGGRAIAATW